METTPAGTAIATTHPDHAVVPGEGGHMVSGPWFRNPRFRA